MKNSKFKKQLPNIILAIVFIIGFGIFLYPSISDFINIHVQSKEINKYKHLVSELSTEEYDKLIEEAVDYNDSLVGYNLAQNIEKVNNTNYYNLLSLDNKGIIGYLAIDKIDVKLPIYHGTDASILQIGIGHLAGTSLPVESKTSHCVISGHTGLPSAKLLTDLVELQVGDTFRINVLNQRYVYEIDQILVVEPNETESLELVEGKQYATIITCTPYGVNTHRLLVRGELKSNTIDSDVSGDATIIDSNTITIIISIILIIILYIIMIMIRKKKEKQQKTIQNIGRKNDDEKKDSNM